MKSLDPRINRLHLQEGGSVLKLQKNPEQFATYEVFLQKRDNSPFEHVGIVHAPDTQLALILAKEQFSRRASCSGLMVISTAHIVVSPYTDMEEDVYDQIDIEEDAAPAPTTEPEAYFIFHMTRRGKQHKYAGTISAKNYEEAFRLAKHTLKEEKPVLNVWLMKEKDTVKFEQEDKDIWSTLSEKRHRDVTSYRAKAELDRFKQKSL